MSNTNILGRIERGVQTTVNFIGGFTGPEALTLGLGAAALGVRLLESESLAKKTVGAPFAFVGGIALHRSAEVVVTALSRNGSSS